MLEVVYCGDDWNRSAIAGISSGTYLHLRSAAAEVGINSSENNSFMYLWIILSANQAGRIHRIPSYNWYVGDSK